MVRPVQIRLAGTLLATATCALAATNAASAQEAGNGYVLNNQLQLGDVIAGQTLNVENGRRDINAISSAHGNAVAGAVEGGYADVTNRQDMRGDAQSTVTYNLTGDTNAFVRGGIQATGNQFSGTASGGAHIEMDSRQSVDTGRINAQSTIAPTTARLHGGALIGVDATANNMALVGDSARYTGTVEQSNSAVVTSQNFVGSQYAPGRAEYWSQSTANNARVGGEGASSQNLTVRQTSDASYVQAGTSANAANAWNLAGRANAAANRGHYYNEGGAQVLRTEQSSSSTVRAASVVTAYDFGAVQSVATAAGNDVVAGNYDIHMQINNTQLNTGGVSAEASFSGAQGYDVVMGANASGNSVSAWGCSTCNGYMWATNNQTNNGNVSAVINGTATNGARSVISGANAVGNSATFYVTRPGN